MNVDLLVCLLYLIVGLLEIVIGIPLVLQKIKPNHIYGFRTKKTLSNKEIWFKANKYAGQDLIFAGVIVFIGSLFLLFFKNQFNLVELSVFGTLLLLGPLSIVIIRAYNFLKRI